MFCPKCGAQCADDAVFCGSCGNSLKGDAQKPAAAAQPVDVAAAVKKNMNYIMVAIGAVAALLGLVIIIGIFEPTASMGPYSNSVPMSDVPSNFMGILGNILFGLINVVIGAVGILYFLKNQMNMPYYDNFVVKFLKVKEPAFLMGVAGAVGALVQFVCYKLVDVGPVSLNVHWITWVLLVVYAALAVVDKFVLNKK